MNITHDIIASVSGPGWKYGLSRILVDEDGNGAVFIAGSEELFAFFTVNTLSTSRGTGENEDGEIMWRRRGSSCQFKLAKCKISTETMASWWEGSLKAKEPTPAPEPVVEAKAVAEEKPKAKKKAVKKTEPKTESTSNDLDDLL